MNLANYIKISAGFSAWLISGWAKEIIASLIIQRSHVYSQYRAEGSILTRILRSKESSAIKNY